MKRIHAGRRRREPQMFERVMGGLRLHKSKGGGGPSAGGRRDRGGVTAEQFPEGMQNLGKRERD